MCYYCHIFVAIAFIIIMSGKDLNNILGISRSLPALIWGPCLFFFKFCFRIGLGSRTDGKCRISVYFIFSFFVRSRPWILSYVLHRNKRPLSSFMFPPTIFWLCLPPWTTLLHLTGHSVSLCLASSFHCWPEETADGAQDRRFRHCHCRIGTLFLLKDFQSQESRKKSSYTWQESAVILSCF